MLQIALVMFRELLEISVLIGIIVAATKHLKNSSIYVTAGIMSGALIASLIVLSINFTYSAFGGLGDELLDIIIIIITVLTVAMTALWINSGRSIGSKIEILSEKFETSLSAKILLISVIAFTISREGTEMVLLIHSIISTTHSSLIDYALGFSAGAITGISTGVAVYMGFNRLNVKMLFKWSFLFLTLIAAGLASEAAGKMVSIGLIDFLNTPLWDSSWIVSDRSIIGQILKVFIGYNSRPNGIQILLYFSTITLVYACAKFSEKKRNV